MNLNRVFIMLSAMLVFVSSFFLLTSCENSLRFFDSDTVESSNDENVQEAEIVTVKGNDPVAEVSDLFNTSGLIFNDESQMSFATATYLSRAKYSFDNNLLDSSGNNYHALVASGQAVYDQGAYGSSFYFNNSWLTVPDSSEFNFERTDVLCFDVWVKRTYLKDEENIVSRMEHADGNPESKDMKGWKLYFEDNGKVTFILRHSWDSEDHKDLLMAQTIKRFGKKNKWYHIELFYDGSSTVAGVQIKVDGEFQSINAIHDDLNDSILSNAPLLIGGPNNLTSSFTGYIDELEINMDCHSDPCDGVACGTNSHCETIEGSASCVCDPGYTEEIDDGTCINEKQVNCTDAAPENATSTIIQVTVTYTDENGWSTPAECEWTCNTDYISEDGLTCIDSKEVNCTDNAPANAASVTATVIVTYTTADGWTAPQQCAWTCNTDYIANVTGTACINTMMTACADNAPENATAVIEPVTITYTTAGGWSMPSDCLWTCNEGYENLGDGQCTPLSNACNGITCSGHGTCSPSDILELRVGGSGNDTLRGMALSNSGTLAYGGYTDGIMTGVLSLNTYEQLVAGITDDMLNHILFVQNEEDEDNALKDIAYGNGIFAVFIQNGYQQKIVTVSSDGIPQGELNLSVPFGIEKIAVTSTGNFVLTGSSEGNNSIIGEITNTGTVVWTQQLNSTDWMRIESVDINNTGNIAVSGTVKGDLYSISNGGNDAFIAVFNSSGTLLWGVQTGTSGSDQDVAVSFDNSGNVITSFNTDGSFSGSNAGFMDAALVKYSGVDGTEIWRTQTGTPAFDAPFSVTVSPEGQIYLAGATLGSIDGNINEGAGVYGMNTADVFITEFNGNGVKYSTVTYGDILHDWMPVKIEAAGNDIIYVAGNTGHLDFEQGILYSDMFILKIDMTGTADYPECTCDAGFININNECVAEQTCSALDCGTAGTCEIKNRQPVCICSEGFVFNGISCVDIFDPCEGVDCSGNGQCQPDSNNEPFCNCYSGFTNDGNPLQCINQKNVQCIENYVPNSTNIISYNTVYYYEGYGWSYPGTCQFECNYGYYNNGWSCINTMWVQCTDTYHENGYSTIETVEIFYNPEIGWGQIPECEWKCYYGYVSEDGVNCINQKTVPCIENSPENAHSTVSVLTVYYDPYFREWPEYECPWECDLNYDVDWSNLTCRNEMQVDCYATYLPQNAYFPVNEIQTLTYTTANGWTWPEQCEWECKFGYILEDDLFCINERQVPCIEVYVENGFSIQTPMPIYYNPYADEWSAPQVCPAGCNADYISEDGATCINQKYVPCTKPLNSTADVYDVLITYTDAGGWTAPESCVWTCNTNYTRVGDICVADTRTVACQNVKPDGTVWSIFNTDGMVFQTWNGIAWIPSEFECKWNCEEEGYIYQDGRCVGELPPYYPSNPYPVNGAEEIPYGAEIQLTWVGGDPFNEAVTYEVKLDTVLPPKKVVCKDAAVESCSVDALLHSKNYFWQVTATNANGKFISGPVWRFRTATDSSDPAPVWSSGSAITVERTGSSSVELSWNAASDNIGVRKYVIYANDIPVKNVMSPLLSATIIPLSPETEYNIKIEACDTSRCSEDGPTSVITTLPIENTEIQYEDLDASNFIRLIDRYRSFYRETETTEPVQHFVKIKEGDDYSPIFVDQVSIVSGSVFGFANEIWHPMKNALVYVKDHPEFGYTRTDNDGNWTMIVNGGPAYVFVFEREGFLSAQRSVKTEWEMAHEIEMITMVYEAPSIGSIDLSSGTTQFVDAPNQIYDGRGERRVTIVVSPGTEAYAVSRDGTFELLENITVRLTEYTTRAGKSAMPAPLPAGVAYTYCSELTVEEAPDAKSIVFSKPVYYYLDNFLGFPVGTAIPNGSFNRDASAWEAQNDGVVIGIVSIKERTDGTKVAEIDINGDGIAETPGVLFNDIEITDDELQLLAQKYEGWVLYHGLKTLWRVPIAHFSPHDLNLLFGIDEDAVYPEAEVTVDDAKKKDCEQTSGGSIISCESRTLGEEINIPGTGLSFYYDSDNLSETAGKKISVKFDVDNLNSYRRDPYAIPPQVNVKIPGVASIGGKAKNPYEFAALWDGRDTKGYVLNGERSAEVSITYKYPVYYQCQGYQKSAFSFGGGAALSILVVEAGGIAQFIENTKPCGFIGYEPLVSKYKTRVFNYSVNPSGFGGLSLDITSRYDVKNDTLYRGDGSTKTSKYNEKIINMIAEAVQPSHIKQMPDGSIIFVEHGRHIKKLSPDGTLTTVAGGGTEEYYDGINPLDVSISVTDMTIDKMGRIFFTDAMKYRVLKIDLDGLIYIVAGTGDHGAGSGPEGDGGFAVDAPMNQVGPITVASDGTIYFFSNTTIRKISDGIINSPFPVNFGSNSVRSFQRFDSLAITLDDKVLLFSGRYRNIYDNKEYDYIGRVNLEGTPVLSDVRNRSAVDAVMVNYLSIYPTGTADDLVFYFSNVTKETSYGGSIVNYFSYISLYDNGAVTNVLGGPMGYGGDGGLAMNATFGEIVWFTFSQMGEMLITDTWYDKIRKVGTQASSQKIGEYAIPDYSEKLLSFDHYGKHLSTYDTVTGSELYSFQYEKSPVPGAGTETGEYIGNVLRKIIDVDGRETTIDRSDPFNIRIISPDGLESILILNSDGLASEFMRPDGTSYYFDYMEAPFNDLLTRITYPNGRYTDYTYDSEGRLEKVIDQKTTELNPFKELSSIESADKDETITLLKRAEGGETLYKYKDDGTAIDRQMINPDGTSSVLKNTLNEGKTVKNENAGETIITINESDDPRFGYLLPYVSSKTIQTGTQTMVTTTAKSASLTDYNDLLSHTFLTDTTTINGKVWRSQFNRSAKSWTLTTPMNRMSQRFVNEKGRTTSVVNPDIEPVSFTYRTDGRVENVSQGTGTEERTLTVSYYGHTDETTGALKGEVSTILDPELHTVDFEYDLMGRVTRKIFEKNTIDQRIVEYVYDAGGNVLAITPAGRPAHNFYYDSVDLPYIYDAPEVAQLMPEEVRTQYNYNLDRQLESIVRPDGSSIYLTYELTKEGYSTSTGKLQKITVPGRGDINLTYKATGGKKLSTVTTPEGNMLSYTYNGALMASESWSGAVTGTVSRTYNNDFRTTAVTTGGISAGYTYDSDGLLLTAGDMTITRDPESGMVTGTALDTVTTTQTYNQFGEIETYDAGDYSYDIISRDKLGRITEKSETIEGVTTTYQYTYDRAGRLETVWENGLFVSQYTYDSNGNRTSHNATTATYNDQDMMLTYGDNSYTYTANGDLMVKTGVEGTTTYTHDALGNLSQVNLPNNDVISYTYDGRNRRIAKMINGTVTERFVYQNQLKPAAKVDANGNILEQYIYGTRINTPDYIIKNGEQYRVVSDERGSVRLVVKVSDGTVSQRIDYDEFGIVLTDSNPGFQPFYYAGGVYDLDTQLVKFGARDYDPATGRWLQKEPLGFNGSDNFYVYAGSDPINYFDIDGYKRKKASTAKTSSKSKILKIITAYGVYQCVVGIYDASQRPDVDDYIEFDPDTDDPAQRDLLKKYDKGLGWTEAVEGCVENIFAPPLDLFEEVADWISDAFDKIFN